MTSEQQLKLVSDTLHEVASTLALIAIINSLEKAVSAEERFVLCKSLSEVLNSLFGNPRVTGSPHQSYQEQAQFGNDPRFF